MQKHSRHGDKINHTEIISVILQLFEKFRHNCAGGTVDRDALIVILYQNKITINYGVNQLQILSLFTHKNFQKIQMMSIKA